MEEKIILDNLGYEPAEIANTGFARWDVLKDCSQENHNILIMPTWRNWLDSVSDEAFENSAYFRNYMQLLNSERFSEILEKYDLQIYFYLHAKFRHDRQTDPYAYQCSCREPHCTDQGQTDKTKSVCSGKAYPSRHWNNL